MSKFPDELEPKFRDSAEPMLSDFNAKSVALCIQRYIDDMASSGFARRALFMVGESCCG